MHAHTPTLYYIEIHLHARQFQTHWPTCASLVKYISK